MSISKCFRLDAARVVAAVAVALTALVLMGGLLVVGCGSGGGGGDSASTTASTSVSSSGGGIEVVMSNSAYDPATVTIGVGETVTWVNQDAPRHDVVADNGEFASGLFDEGQSFSFTFTEAGTYPYHCSIHPGMTGTVIVQ